MTKAPILVETRTLPSSAVIARRTRLVDIVAVAVAAAATLALVLPWYTTRPFWFDELVSIEIADLPPHAFVHYVFTVEANMALYHALLGPWLLVTGSVAGVRALSIVFAVATLPFLYGLGLRLFGRPTAITAVLLMAVNVSYVGFARDARSYALTLFLVTAASYFLARALDRDRGLDWALYAVLASLSVSAHFFAGLVVAAQLTWLVLERRRIPRGHPWQAAVGIGVLLLPLALAVAINRQGAQLDWLQRPGIQKLPGLLQWFVESRVAVVLYAAGGAVGLVQAVQEWRRPALAMPRRHTLLALWLALPVLVAFVLSYATPLYLYRYFMVCLPALVLLVAAGLMRITPVWLGIALVAATVAVSVRTVAHCQPDCKIRYDDWRSAAGYLSSHARPGDAIVAYPAEVRTPLDHYLGATRPRLLYPARWPLTGGATLGAGTLDASLRRVGRYRRIWLVTWWLPSDQARLGLARQATLLRERDFAGNVTLRLYRPR